MEVDGKLGKIGTELCVPCQTDGVTTEPDGFCKDCEECMCQQCFKYHLRAKSCRNHVLSNTDARGEKICSKHINETVQVYCRKHDLVGCGNCMIPDHGKCKPEVIREIATDFEQFLEFKGMLRQVDQCDIDLTESESHIEQNRRENKNMISDALNEIRKFRTDINNYYDRVETEIVTEANNVAKENEELMSKLEVKILSFRQEIAEIKETLDTSRITTENLFIRVIENKRKFYQIEKLVAELKMKNNLKVFKFEAEQRVKELQSSGVKLGNLTMSIHKYQPSANSEDATNSSNETKINENTLTTTITETLEKPYAVLQNVLPQDQWSPLNLDGKKHYDREFMLKFQNDSHAIQKPAGLPDIPDTMLDKPQVVDRQFSHEQQPGNEGQPDFMDFTPRYMSGVGYGGVDGSMSQGMDNVSISKDIELHKAKEAWKPTHIEPPKEADAGTEELYKKTRSIINKLTPQKFQTLVSQMQALPIDSEDKLKGVVNLVFEKAISEPGFSVAYANMCRCLSMFKVPSDSKPGEMVNFRAVLLTKCQREFEKDKSSEALFITKREEIDKSEVGAKKEELKQDLAYEESKSKRRSLGNIRFIGELFKLKMLTENIMHDCVYKLLRTKDPENLECLCRLLTTIGKELDVEKAKPRMDQYFYHMSKIVNDKMTVSRVLVMLQDVMDLRTNKWVPQRVDNNPKTIDQIHKDVAREAQEKALISQQNQMAARSQGSGGGGGGGRRGPPGQMGGSQDGLNTVASNRTPLKSVDRSIETSKMKLPKQNVDESAIQLGSGGSARRFAGWGQGNTGGTTGRPSQEKEKPNTPANRASCSSLSVDGSHRERSRGPAEQERQPSPAQPSSSELKLLSPDKMEKKTKAILDEYFAVQDMKEAILCVQELSAQNHHQFVLYAINHVLERSSTARKQTGHVLHDLVKQKVISVDNYIKGLVEVLEFAKDLEIDIPKIWQYYGEMISPMIQDNSVPLSFLKQAAQPLIANNKAGVLLAEILHDASHREGLEFTNGGDSAPTTSTTGLPLKDIETKLNDLIVQKKADNEKVFDWIEGNVDEPTTKQPKFIRSLMTAVCTSAIKGEKGKERLEPEEISNRNDLLRKYLGYQAETELQALYALQALITKLEHPQGILRGMFDTLYDKDIISEDAFFQWEMSEEEPGGKDSCLKQVVQFFTWLREAEDDS